ncbi:PPCDC [Acanthosepion pharaonis]|uniref:Phosphopantothenoylcysteine decarboxylase n=1 Tax=Acanthosepion pharaonis TaxID=158019 RepID=A0A812BKQ5_ACAPH|nr:PPCDC [Sepia pharaonis]
MAGKHVLLACTGSVASIKIPLIIQQLQEADPSIEIRLVVTDKSLHFFDAKSVPVDIYKDEDEWKWQKMKDPVLHIELRRWADLMVISPLDANTLAKIANGLCDNLLTSIVRAWDMKCPLLFAPAMNTMMWEHVLTKKHIDTLTSFGYIEIPCVAKKLACDDTGMGAMAAVDTIVSNILSCLQPFEEKSSPVNEISVQATSPESVFH